MSEARERDIRHSTSCRFAPAFARHFAPRPISPLVSSHLADFWRRLRWRMALSMSSLGSARGRSAMNRGVSTLEEAKWKLLFFNILPTTHLASPGNPATKAGGGRGNGGRGDLGSPIIDAGGGVFGGPPKTAEGGLGFFGATSTGRGRSGRADLGGPPIIPGLGGRSIKGCPGTA